MTTEIDRPFALEIVDYDDATVIGVVGELDLTTSPRLRAALGDVVPRRGRLVLDLARVRFLDSTALHLLVTEYRAAEAAGRELVICGLTREGMRLMRIAGLDVALPLAPDRASVLTQM